MSAVLLAALGFGLGAIALIHSLRRRVLTLDEALRMVMTTTEAPSASGADRNRHRPPWRVDEKAASRVALVVRRRGLHERLASRMALCGISLEELCRRCVVGGMIGLALPVLAWSLVVLGGLHIQPLLPVWLALLTGVAGSLVPGWLLVAEARQRRRYAVRVVCSFLDLVVLALAGGMGIESALFCAAEVGENDLSHSLRDALTLSRDSGTAPWTALRDLGSRLGVGELEELASAAAMAGTEGSKVRATLAARAAAIRRHELAEAEAEANALTEKLFIPGTLLLLGFLLFVGYPAVARIMSGL